MKKDVRWRELVLIVLLTVLSVINVYGAGQQAKKSDEYFIGFAQDTLNQPWRNYQAVCVESELKRHGITQVIVTDGQGRAERQISNIEDMVSRGMNLLITSPAQEGALTPVVQQVYRKGIPVVLIDRGIQGDGYTTFIQANNFAIAEMVADYIAQKMVKKYGEPRGKIVVIEGVPGSTTAVQRNDGFKKRIQDKYPKLEIIASQPANYRRDMARKVMEDFLQAFDQIDAIFTHADEMTMGAIYAIENVNRRNEMLITSVNGTMEAIKAIMDGRMDCTPLYTNASGPGVEFALKILKGEKVPKHVILEPLMIDESNAKDFYIEGKYSPDPIPLNKQKYIIAKE